MKWTRASERLPEATFPDLYNFGRGPCSQTMPVKFNGVPYSGAYYPKEDFFAIAFHERLYKKEDYDKIEWLDESDESPESSIWPGEITSNTLWNKYRSENKIDGKFRMDVDHFHNAIDELKQWLQSRTAVKAEERSFANLIDDGKGNLVPAPWMASGKDFEKFTTLTTSETTTNINATPQPTAGGVNSPKDLLSGNIVSETYSAQTIGKSSSELPENEPNPANLRAKSEDRANDSTLKSSHVENSEENQHQGGVKEEGEERSKAQQIMDIIFDEGGQVHKGMYDKVSTLIATWEHPQPSPSNPSIKRPTEEEIKKALSNWILESVHPSDGPASAIAWIEAINWLLSIQPDKL